MKQSASLRKISHEKVKQKKVLQPSEGFEAVEELKRFTDMKDELLIHNIDKNEQFVFKTSKTKMKMAAEMNIFFQKSFVSLMGIIKESAIWSL